MVYLNPLSGMIKRFDEASLMFIVGYICSSEQCGLWASCFCFYQGVVPTAQRAAIIAGVELPVYDFSKYWILKSGYLKDGVGTHFMYVRLID